jgi:uncharacterized membrane protein
VNLEFSAMQIFAWIVRFDFLALVGVGMVISYYRILGKMENSVSLGRARWRAILQQWKRGSMVGGCAMVVTAATYLYVREDFVRFGILHLIGVSVFLEFLWKGNGLFSFGFGEFLVGWVVFVDGNWWSRS